MFDVNTVWNIRAALLRCFREDQRADHIGADSHQMVMEEDRMLENGKEALLQLSVNDITQLHQQVCELRKTVSLLETKLSHALNTTTEQKSAPLLCSVCKADLNPKPQEAGAEAEAGQTSTSMKEKQNPQQESDEEDKPSPCSLYTEPNPSESGQCNGAGQDAGHTPLTMCSVRQLDCKTETELNGTNVNNTQEYKLDDGLIRPEDLEESEEPELDPDVDDFCPSGGESFDEEYKSVKQKKKKRDPGCKSIVPCTVCGQELRSEVFLTKHMKMHENHANAKLLRPHVCPVCSKGYPTRRGLKVHEKSHSGEKPFCCELCGSSFTTKGNLKCHQSIHTGQRQYQCSYCEKCFYHKTHLRKHERVHTKEKPYLCSYCNKGFSTVTAMKQHQRVHTGEKPYPCSYCEMMFGQKVNRDRHERIHTGEKPYLCDHCGKGFSDPKHFSTHKQIHGGESRERPFQCSFCGKSFYHRINLKQHERVHTQERPYSCSHCDKTFARPDVLKTHLRIHTKEKPYQCSICDQSFAYLGSFRAHQRNHCKEEPKPLPEISTPAGPE